MCPVQSVTYVSGRATDAGFSWFDPSRHRPRKPLLTPRSQAVERFLLTKQ